MPIPCNNDIKKLLEGNFRSHYDHANLRSPNETLFQFGDLDKLFAEDIDITVVGQEFALAKHVKGRAKFEDHLTSGKVVKVPALSSIIDVTKPIEGQPVQVIGGEEDQWKAATLYSKATTVKNQPWEHEMVVIMRFNGDGKIVELRAYPDTQYITNRIAEFS